MDGSRHVAASDCCGAGACCCGLSGGAHTGANGLNFNFLYVADICRRRHEVQASSLEDTRRIGANADLDDEESKGEAWAKHDPR